MNRDDQEFDPPPPPPSAEELRAELLRFARGILRLDEEDRLLSSPADLQTVLGELRRRLFEWEVRRAAELGAAKTGSGGSESEQVVREAREADASLRRDLEGATDPGDAEEGDREGPRDDGGPDGGGGSS